MGEAENGERRSDLAAAIHDLSKKIDALMAAFPGDDPGGHRRYHEVVIKRAEARAMLFEKLRFELVKWGLLGFLGWLVLIAWQAILKGPR